MNGSSQSSASGAMLAVKRRIARLRDADYMREIARKGAVAFGLKVAGAGLAFVFQLAIARFLGASGAGIYFLSVTIITLVATLSRLGMENSVTRFTAAYSSDDDWGKIAGVYRHAVRITFVVSLFCSLLLAATAGFWAELVFKKPELTASLRLMAIAIIPLSLMTLQSKALQGLKNVRDSMLMLSVLTPLLAGVSLFILAPGLGVEGAVTAYIIGISLNLAYGLLRWNSTKKGWGEVNADFPLKTLIVSSLPLLGAIGLQQLTMSLPTLLLGVWGSSADVGLFNISQRTAAIVNLVLVAGNSIIAPKFAVLYHKGDTVSLGKVARHGALMMTAMAFPAVLVFLAAPRWVMSLFGAEFSSAGLMLVIMALGQLVNVATGAVGFLLIMTGQERSYLGASLFAAAINVTLSIILIPSYGALGAAVAAAVSLAAVNIVRVRYVWRTMGIMTLPFIKVGKGAADAPR